MWRILVDSAATNRREGKRSNGSTWRAISESIRYIDGAIALRRERITPKREVDWTIVMGEVSEFETSFIDQRGPFETSESTEEALLGEEEVASETRDRFKASRREELDKILSETPFTRERLQSKQTMRLTLIGWSWDGLFSSLSSIERDLMTSPHSQSTRR
jgi:hypothetical protein